MKTLLSKSLAVLTILSLLLGAAPIQSAQAGSTPVAHVLRPAAVFTCTDTIGCVTIAPTEPIHIAYALTVEGVNASLGIDSRNGAEIAIADAGGQILDHDIRFDGQDEGCSAEGGLAAGTALATDPSIVAVIGTTCSSAAHTAMPLLSTAGFAMVSPSNTAPDLTESGNPNNKPGYLRVAWNDKVQGVAAAHFAWEYLGITTAATVNDGNLYSESLTQKFANEFTSLGGTITTQKVVEMGVTDISAMLNNIASGNPQLIYLPVFTDSGPDIISRARGVAGLEGVYLMGADGLYTEEIVDSLGRDVEGFMVTNYDLSKNSPVYTSDFLPAYQAKFGTKPTSLFHAHAYDAFNLIKAAIEDVAVVDPDGTLHIGREALRTALYSTTNFSGLTGSLTCNATGDCADPHFAVYRYHANQPQPEYIWPDFVPLSWSAQGCDGNLIQSVEATGQHSVTFNLCRADATFLSKIAMPPFFINPQEWVEATSGETNRTTWGLEHPVGTGPYKVSEWQRGTSLTLVKNPNYWGAPPETDTLTFRWSGDAAANLTALQNGTIDGYNNVMPEQYAAIQADSNLQLVLRPQLNTFYVGMTNTFEPFGDVRVRQAVAQAIDRQYIVDNYYPEGSEVATHFTPCSIPNGCVGNAWYAYDPAGAKTLLTAAGYPTGFQTHLYYRNVYRGYLPQPLEVAQKIHDQLLSNLGINAELVEMDAGIFVQQVNAGNLNGFYLLGWGADYPHVSNFLDYHFGQNNRQFGNPFPDIYNNLNMAAQYTNPLNAEPYYTAANNAIRNLAPMVPIAHAGSMVAYRADVTNPQAGPMGNDFFAFSDPGGRTTFNWTQAAEPASLFCADEADGESFRACNQILQPLYAFKSNSSDVEPALAESCTPNAGLTVWTCNLRQNVKFHNGSGFDANDVVATFTMGLDTSSPTHKGNTNSWGYYDFIWGLINVPPIIKSITLAHPNPINLTSADFVVKFSEPVTGVGAEDFKLTTTTLTGASIIDVSNSGAGLYTVTVNTGTGNGRIHLDILETASIQDLGGNSFVGPYTGGETYTVSKGAAPTIPVLKSPANGAFVTGYLPTLDWNDSSQVMSLANDWSYEINVTDGAAYHQTFNTPSGLSNSTYTFTSPLSESTTFTWKVRAYNDQNQYSAWSASRTFRTPPAAVLTKLPAPVLTSPANTTSPVLNNMRPTFTWEAVSGAMSYTLQILSSGKVVNTGTIKVPFHSYTPTKNLLPDTIYTWQVKANGKVSSDYSAPFTFKTSVNPPAVPVLVSPTNKALVSSTAAQMLKWKLASGSAASYEVEYATDAAFSDAESGISSSTELSLAAGSFLPNHTYYWHVRSWSEAGAKGNHSYWSAVRTFRTKLSTPVLNLPANGTTLDNKRPTFTWDEVPGATAYTLQVLKDGKVIVTGNIKAPAYVYTPLKDLLPEITYTWKVKANGTNPGDYSAPYTFTTSINPPKTPVLSAPANNALVDSSVVAQVFKWGAVLEVVTPASPAAGSYEVEYATNAGFINSSPTIKVNAPATEATPITLLPGRTYYWHVRSWSSADVTGNHSAWSKAWTIKVKFVAPTLTSPASGNTNVPVRPTFTWSSANGLWTFYTLQIAPDNAFGKGTRTIKVNAPTTKYAIPDSQPALSAGIQYCWRVKINGVYFPVLSSMPGQCFTTTP